MKWLNRAEDAIVADEAEIRRMEKRLHTHLCLICVSITVGIVVYTIGLPEQIVIISMGLATGCQEYVDYIRRV